MLPESAPALARLSEWVYEPPEALEDRLPGLELRGAAFRNGPGDVRFVHAADAAADTEVYALRTEADDVVVAFRGSETDFTTRSGAYRDWLRTDVDALTEPCRWLRQPDEGASRALVHRGFQRAYRLVRWALRGHVDALVQAGRGPGRRIYLTGHSLGGAIALHAASDLARYAALPLYLVSFAAPRAGNGRFAASVARDAADLTLVVQRGDPVPWMPPVGPNTDITHHRFEHPPGIVYIDGQFRTHAGLPPAHVAANPEHHRITSYQAAVARALG